MFAGLLINWYLQQRKKAYGIYIDSIEQDGSNTDTLAMELLQYCINRL